MYKLVIEDDEGSKSTVPVIRDEITIGRAEGNTIRLTERNVSRRHARVVRDNGRVYVEDVAARYGIKKNGVKIDQRAEFAPGDMVLIGDYQLTLKAKQTDKAPGPPPKQAKRPPAEKKQDEGTQVLPAMPAKLVVVSSNFAGQEFPLNRKEMIIGRGEDCDIIIDHRSVSQKHAKVIREPGNKYQIVDLNSKNGITIGGEQYRAVHVKRGDVLELGHVKFRFVEPGENYVFTPQPALDDFEPETKESKNGMMVGAVLLVAALVGGALFFFMNGSGGDDAGAHDAKANAVASNAQGEGADTEPSNAGGAQKAAPAKEPNKVDQAIEEARTSIQDGNLDKAMGTLESAKKYLDPTPAQNDTIAELIGNAKNEKPFKKDYQAAKDYLKSDDYMDALERLSKIPKHSVFYATYRDEGLMGQAVDGLVVKAEDAFAKEDTETAKKLAQEALVYDSEHAGAKSLLDQIEADAVKMAVNEKSSNSGSGHSSGGSHRGSSRPDPPKHREPKVSAAEAKELYRSAQKKIFKSDPNGAVEDCKKALKGGYRGCYRILAIAYKQMGNNGAACSNFKRYLGTKPRNASAVQRQMEQLGCN